MVPPRSMRGERENEKSLLYKSKKEGGGNPTTFFLVKATKGGGKGGRRKGKDREVRKKGTESSYVE